MYKYDKPLFKSEGSFKQPEADQVRLPPGYTQDLFEQDVRTVFERVNNGKTGAPEWNGHLTDVPESWAVSEECRTGKPPERWDEERYRNSAKTWGQTLHRVGRGHVPGYFLERNGGDPEAAAQEFVNWLAEEQKQGGRPDQNGKMDPNPANGGKSGGADEGDGQGAQSAIEALDRALRRGDMPGKSDTSMPVSKQLRVAELLPRARKRYEFAAQKSYKTRDTDSPADTFTVRTMNHYAEPLVLEESFLYDTDTQAMRWVTLQAGVIQHQERIPEPQSFTMLLDVSGSMTYPIDSNNPNGYNRDELAAACVIALAEQAQAGGNDINLVPFDTVTHPTITGADDCIKFGWNAAFKGGGTDFDTAVKKTNESDADYVVMVTDGDDTLNVNSKVPLNVLNVAGKHNTTLAQRAAKYDIV